MLAPVAIIAAHDLGGLPASSIVSGFPLLRPWSAAWLLTPTGAILALSGAAIYRLPLLANCRQLPRFYRGCYVPPNMN